MSENNLRTWQVLIIAREKGRNMTQSYDKSPYRTVSWNNQDNQTILNKKER